MADSTIGGFDPTSWIGTNDVGVILNDVIVARILSSYTREQRLEFPLLSSSTSYLIVHITVLRTLKH